VRRKVAIVIPYLRHNRFSYNVILAALEKENIHIPVYLIRSKTYDFIEEIHGLAKKYDVLVLAISIMTTQIVDMLDEIRKINKMRPNNVISVAGGPHPSGDPCGTLDLGFDFVFIGEAEMSFSDFIMKLIDNEDVFSTKGISYKHNGEYFMTERPPPIDLNEYPPFPVGMRMFNPIEITRGCPYACRYCQVTYLHGARPRHRDIERILEYCEVMIKANKKDLRFISPNSFGYGSIDGRNVNYDALAELIDKLYSLVKKEGGRIFFGSFPSEVRPDFVDEDVLRIIKGKVANRRIIVGAQSGSDEILKKIHRGHTVEDIINAVEIIQRYGFRADVDFIFGLPGEKEEDLVKTERIIQELVKMGARIHAHTFIPLPGTPFYKEAPGKIPKRIKKLLYRLTGKGHLYGYWESQERLARKIVELRERGIIKADVRPKLVKQ